MAGPKRVLCCVASRLLLMRPSPQSAVISDQASWVFCLHRRTHVQRGSPPGSSLSASDLSDFLSGELDAESLHSSPLSAGSSLHYPACISLLPHVLTQHLHILQTCHVISRKSVFTNTAHFHACD